MIGQRFGAWMVLAKGGKDVRRNVRWLCLCDCGTRREVNGYALRNGASTCCGCGRREHQGISPRGAVGMLARTFGYQAREPVGARVIAFGMRDEP